jgi:hypothetical protein
MPIECVEAIYSIAPGEGAGRDMGYSRRPLNTGTTLGSPGRAFTPPDSRVLSLRGLLRRRWIKLQPALASLLPSRGPSGFFAFA